MKDLNQLLLTATLMKAKDVVSGLTLNEENVELLQDIDSCLFDIANEEVVDVAGELVLQWWRGMTDKQQETFLNMKGYGVISGMPRSVSSLTTREVKDLYRKFLSERGIQ